MQPSRAERARCPLPICSLQVRLIHFFLCRRPWISSNKSSTPCSPPASPTGGTLFHFKKKKNLFLAQFQLSKKVSRWKWTDIQVRTIPLLCGYLNQLKSRPRRGPFHFSRWTAFQKPKWNSSFIKEISSNSWEKWMKLSLCFWYFDIICKSLSRDQQPWGDSTPKFNRKGVGGVFVKDQTRVTQENETERTAQSRKYFFEKVSTCRESIGAFRMVKCGPRRLRLNTCLISFNRGEQEEHFSEIPE